MKLVIISTNADFAGAPLHVKTLVDKLRARHSIAAIFGEDGPVSSAVREYGVATYIVPELRSRVNLYLDWLCVRRLIELLRVIKPDLVHLHSTKAGLLGRIACTALRIPVLYSVHGWGWRGFSRIPLAVYMCIEWVAARTLAARYLYVSNSVRAEGESILGLSSKHGRVIWNGVDRGPLRPEPVEPKLRILMAARVSSAKDHETLVRAFERLDFSSELALCGSGTAESGFQKLVMAWAPNRWRDVTLLGERNDVPRLMDLSNVVVLISNFEALPLSIIEAMAAQRCIIASNVGGMSELIEDNKSGILVDRGDIFRLVCAFKKVKEIDTRRSFARSAWIRYKESFSVDRMINQIEKYYEEIVGEYRR